MGASQQRQHSVAKGKQRVVSGGKWLAARGQQGGDIAWLLIGHGRCCFVMLLRCQPLTYGVCDNVLDVVKGIDSETVIKLMQEEKVIKGKIWFRQENVYLRWNQEDVTHWKIRLANETTMKMTHKDIGICRRYVLQKEMCF
jgi:hypothetical protein